MLSPPGWQSRSGSAGLAGGPATSAGAAPRCAGAARGAPPPGTRLRSGGGAHRHTSVRDVKTQRRTERCGQRPSKGERRPREGQQSPSRTPAESPVAETAASRAPCVLRIPIHTQAGVCSGRPLSGPLAHGPSHTHRLPDSRRPAHPRRARPPARALPGEGQRTGLQDAGRGWVGRGPWRAYPAPAPVAPPEQPCRRRRCEAPAWRSPARRAGLREATPQRRAPPAEARPSERTVPSATARVSLPCPQTPSVCWLGL